MDLITGSRHFNTLTHNDKGQIFWQTIVTGVSSPIFPKVVGGVPLSERAKWMVVGRMDHYCSPDLIAGEFMASSRSHHW